jgi:hypothetical protein
VISGANNPSPENLVITGEAVLIPLVVEGSDLPIAYGVAVYDGSEFAAQTITEVFRPDSAQSDTINMNGYTVTAPNAVDWNQVLGVQ